MVTRKQFFQLLAFFLSWRVVLFVIGALSDFILPYAPSFPYAENLLPSFNSPRWLYSWANFDGVHYLTIAQSGYIGTGLIQAFFPFLPYILLHLPRLLLGTAFNPLIAGLVFTNIATFLLMMTWFLFVQSKIGEKAAWLSVLLLFLFPTSFFFGTLYTEAFFLLFVIAAFYSLDQKKWWLMALMVMAATATRVVGIFLLPALLMELWMQWREKSGKKPTYDLHRFVEQEWKGILALSLGSLGLLSYMLFLWIEFHDPLYFIHVQSEFGAGRQEAIILYPQVIWRYLKILVTVRPIDVRYFAYFQEFIAGTLGLLALLWSWKRVRTSYLLFALGSFFLPTLTGTFSSMPRYILVCFPLFLFLTFLLQKKKRYTVLWLGVSTLLLIFNTILFIQGYWVA